MDKCISCDEEAAIIRRHSGEKYCIKHAKEKLLFSNLREISRRSRKPVPNRRYVLIGRYPPEYRVLLEATGKYFSNFIIDIEITKYLHHSNFHSESSKIIDEYSKLEDYVQDENSVIVIIKTADLIAHDILFLILENKLELLEKLGLRKDRLIFPFKNTFLHEVVKILEIQPKPYKYCSIYRFIEKTMDTRPTTIYGIFNYIKNLSELGKMKELK